MLLQNSVFHYEMLPIFHFIILSSSNASYVVSLKLFLRNVDYQASKKTIPKMEKMKKKNVTMLVAFPN